jgi:hypothetical protein
MPLIRDENDLYKYAAAVNPPLPAYRDYEPPVTPRDGFLLAVNPTDDDLSMEMHVGSQTKREDAKVILRVRARSTVRVPGHWALSLTHSCPQLVLEEEKVK